MKIVKIEEETPYIFRVYLKPNRLEKLFGVKDAVKRYRDSGRIYMFGGVRVYEDERGYELGNCYRASKIDEFRFPFKPF